MSWAEDLEKNLNAAWGRIEDFEEGVNEFDSLKQEILYGKPLLPKVTEIEMYNPNVYYPVWVVLMILQLCNKRVQNFLLASFVVSRVSC